MKTSHFSKQLRHLIRKMKEFEWDLHCHYSLRTKWTNCCPLSCTQNLPAIKAISCGRSFGFTKNECEVIMSASDFISTPHKKLRRILLKAVIK